MTRTTALRRIIEDLDGRRMGLEDELGTIYEQLLYYRRKLLEAAASDASTRGRDATLPSLERGNG